MHGAGNDYVYFDCFSRPIFDPCALSKRISDRHFGVGSDGIVLIEKSKIADAKMRMFNADGSEGAMCGNAVRCVGKFLYEKKRRKKRVMTIETASGVKTLRFTVEKKKVSLVEAEIGAPTFPVPSVLSAELSGKENGEKTELYPVSVGNPHCVVFVDDLSNPNLSSLAEKIRALCYFPFGVNVEFAKVEKDGVSVRVFERGSGETLACGTGACAVAAVCARLKKTDGERSVKIFLKGGTLTVEERNGLLFLIGSASFVFAGKIEIENGTK